MTSQSEGIRWPSQVVRFYQGGENNGYGWGTPLLTPVPPSERTAASAVTYTLFTATGSRATGSRATGSASDRQRERGRETWPSLPVPAAARLSLCDAAVRKCFYISRTAPSLPDILNIRAFGQDAARYSRSPPPPIIRTVVLSTKSLTDPERGGREINMRPRKRKPAQGIYCKSIPPQNVTVSYNYSYLHTRTQDSTTVPSACPR